ncbi:MAG: hypothetical protein RI897_145 [Verrucomicrobiota bacterium]
MGILPFMLRGAGAGTSGAVSSGGWGKGGREGGWRLGLGVWFCSALRRLSSAESARSLASSLALGMRLASSSYWLRRVVNSDWSFSARWMASAHASDSLRRLASSARSGAR